jgi:hypothetical protein
MPRAGEAKRRAGPAGARAVKPAGGPLILATDRPRPSVPNRARAFSAVTVRKGAFAQLRCARGFGGASVRARDSGWIERDGSAGHDGQSCAEVDWPGAMAGRSGPERGRSILRKSPMISG